MGHNLSIDDILEDSNLSYILDNHESDLIREKIQSIDMEISVWRREPIPEQVTLKAIEQTLLDSADFNALTLIKCNY